MNSAIFYIIESTMFLVQASDIARKKHKVLLFIHFLLVQSCDKVRTDPSDVCIQNSIDVSCQHLHIYTIPRNLTTGIKTLDLSHNFIQNLTIIPLSSLYTLLELNIGYNKVENIENKAFHNLSQLYSLNLIANILDKHYFAHKGIFGSLQTLKVLNLANNNLNSEMVSCYLTNIFSLEKLDLSGNTITSLPSKLFNEVLQLSELDLSNNNIMEIEKGTFDSLKELRVLNLALNSLHYICSFNLPQLHFLNLSSNTMGFFFSNNSHELYQLRNLDLSFNNLLHFPVLPKFHMIQYLNLSKNMMAAMTPSFNTTLDDLQDMSLYENIAQMDLYSAVQETVSTLSKLIDLDLSNNHLTTFPLNFLSKLRTLQNLNMAHNCLEYITNTSSIAEPVYNQVDPISEVAVKLNSLRALDLQGNYLRSIPQWLFDIMPVIANLNLKNNKIVICTNPHSKKENSSSNVYICTSFSKALHLNSLNLRGNSIKHLPPRVFQQTSLVSLDISENKGLHLRNNSLEGLQQSLQILLLKGNHMEESQVQLPCLKRLKYLDLSNNRLYAIPPNSYCSHVKTLDLRNNSLHMLDKKATLIWSKSHTHVWINGNPFDCCSLNWLQTDNLQIQDINDTHCIYTSNNMSSRIHLYSDHTPFCSSDSGHIVIKPKCSAIRV
ncbi:transforming growth factor beta activator LRRC32-like [Bombina bombina]|uniref:transforming growth factor beta activator LRRC32-like n=1 Tax=Bombina bombina TaxID=8345 RepID=UPI00235B05A6|nr:transforming growth factor beta activator LRRC32-like [Bombina bombina]